MLPGIVVDPVAPQLGSSVRLAHHDSRDVAEETLFERQVFGRMVLGATQIWRAPRV